MTTSAHLGSRDAEAVIRLVREGRLWTPIWDITAEAASFSVQPYTSAAAGRSAVIAFRDLDGLRELLGPEVSAVQPQAEAWPSLLHPLGRDLLVYRDAEVQVQLSRWLVCLATNFGDRGIEELLTFSFVRPGEQPWLTSLRTQVRRSPLADRCGLLEVAESGITGHVVVALEEPQRRTAMRRLVRQVAESSSRPTLGVLDPAVAAKVLQRAPGQLVRL